MQRIGNIQPDMAIDTRTRIPAAVWLQRIINFDNQYILFLFYIGSKIIVKTYIPIRMFSQVMAIEPYFTVHIYAVKFYGYIFIGRLLRQIKCFAIPADSRRQITSATRRGSFFIKVALYAPV